MASPWDDLDIEAVPGERNRFRACISDVWMLAVVPQGGVVAAIAQRAMAAALDDPSQQLRTMSSVFAGQVAAGELIIEVELLRRGRSMSQLQATVRNPDASAGLTALAVFGAERRGFDFIEVAPPDVAGPEGLRSFRDGVPEGIDFTFERDQMPFWERIVETRPAVGRAPWEPFEEGPSDVVSWHRFDDPPLDAAGRLDVAGPIVVCDTMPGSVGQKMPPEAGTWFAPSVDYTFHYFGSTAPGWLLAHGRARWAGEGYASIELTLWDEQLTKPVAYGTQVMFFAFGR